MQFYRALAWSPAELSPFDPSPLKAGMAFQTHAVTCPLQTTERLHGATAAVPGAPAGGGRAPSHV